MGNGQTSKNTGNRTNSVNNTKKFEQNDIEEAKQHLKLLKEKLGTNSFGGDNSGNKTISNNNYRKPFQPSFENNKGSVGTDYSKNVGSFGGSKTVVKNTINTKTVSQPKMGNNRNFNNHRGGEYEDPRPIGKQGSG
jgi:hypothetical protein